jgi:uncharacterized membrane protein YheB (UPF0754 family)
MSPLLVFLIPPVVGAFIGYSTNVIAIKMLFRPLKERRIFGIRVPFTPGILPRQRHVLAQSIGSMVERELLTPEILRRRLAREDVREKIKTALVSFTEKILEKRPAEIFSGREDMLSSRINSAAEKLYPSVSSSLIDFFHRPDIKRELEARGQLFLRNVFLQMNVFQRFFLTAGQYDITLQEKMPQIIEDLISNIEALLKEKQIKTAFLNTISSSFGAMLGGQGKNIAELLELSEADKKALDDFLFDKFIAATDAQIEGILESINVKDLVADRIDSLDMERVERIILDVMSDQFKWVEIFGGILGFLIGVFQSAFIIFLR